MLYDPCHTHDMQGGILSYFHVSALMKEVFCFNYVAVFCFMNRGRQ